MSYAEGDADIPSQAYLRRWLDIGNQALAGAVAGARSTHQFKYSLFYGRPGERWVGYDNEAGKGDHRHYGPEESDYAFISPEQLMADFTADVAAWRSAKGART